MTSSVNILGVNVARAGMAEALDQIERMICNRTPQLVVTANAEMIMTALANPDFCKIMNQAGLVLPDGAGVVWASRMYGLPVPERVAGYDTVQNLLSIAANKGYRVFWLGAAPGIAKEASQSALQKHPTLCSAGVRDGYFKEHEEQQLINEISGSKPDIILCALGSPRQEIWLSRNLSALGAPVSIGVGGTFDVMAGKVRRAPLWMQKASLEWLFRLAQQPKRFIRMLALPHFVFCVSLSAWTRKS